MFTHQNPVYPPFDRPNLQYYTLKNACEGIQFLLQKNRDFTYEEVAK